MVESLPYPLQNPSRVLNYKEYELLKNEIKIIFKENNLSKIKNINEEEIIQTVKV